MDHQELAFEERIASVRARPDAIMLTSDDAQRRALHFMIPLLQKARDRGGQPQLVGCGAFVRLGARYFLLTAGHVVERLLAGAETRFFPVFDRTYRMRRCVAMRHGSRFQLQESVDFGYIEVSPQDARNWEAGKKVALSTRSIRVATAAELVDDDSYVFAGTPAKLTCLRDTNFIELGLTHFTTTIAGRRAAPPSTLTGAATGIEYLDLAFDPSAVVTRVVDGRLEEAKLLEEIDGVSGGPCLKGNVLPDPTRWSPKSLQLVGTHCGRHVGHRDGTREYWFARQTLIGHHLRLLCTDYANTDLPELLFEAWPALRHWPDF